MNNPKLALETARERTKNARAIAHEDNLTLAMEEVVNVLDYLMERQSRPTSFNVTVGRAGQVVIPQRIREKLGIQPGSEITLDVFLNGGEQS